MRLRKELEVPGSRFEVRRPGSEGLASNFEHRTWNSLRVWVRGFKRRTSNIELRTIFCILLLTAAPALADDRDLKILELRKALAEEKIERLRIEYQLVKKTLEEIAAELAQKQKEVKPDEKK